MARGTRKKNGGAAPKVEAEITLTRRPDAEDVRRAVAEVTRQKESAAEYTGLAGNATKQFCEKWSINKAAFAFVRKLSAMDPQKRQSCLIDAADLCRKMGFTDQMDMFADPEAAVAAMAGDGEAAAPTDEEIRARTEAELAETPDFIRKTHAERIKGEVDDTLNGARPN